MLTCPPAAGSENDVGEMVQLVGAPVPPPPVLVPLSVQLKTLPTIDHPPVQVERSVWVVPALAAGAAPMNRAQVAEASTGLRMCLGERRMKEISVRGSRSGYRVAQDPNHLYQRHKSIRGGVHSGAIFTRIARELQVKTSDLAQLARIERDAVALAGAPRATLWRTTLQRSARLHAALRRITPRHGTLRWCFHPRDARSSGPARRTSRHRSRQ